MNKENNQENPSEIKLVIIVVLGMLILIGAFFVSYRYSQSQPSGIIIPAGSTYLGPSPTPTP
ncbi:hypothetical protein HY029_06170 [Candidatus Gottesmanbacteria bacterium]|nr:hypothetical protein [Candidatus Gottesmanbacteria bacterium]